MNFWIIMAMFVLMGLVSMLPLRSSMYTSALLLIVAMGYFIVVPILDYGVFPTHFFIAATLIVSLFLLMIHMNTRHLKPGKVRKLAARH